MMRDGRLIYTISSYMDVNHDKDHEAAHPSTILVILPHPEHRPNVFPLLMSSTIVPSANFQPILDAALDSYAKQTGIDLRKHPSADKLQSCATSEDVLGLLQDREIAFKDYRDKHRKLINCLRPVVQIVQAFSGALGEVAGLVSHRDLIHLDLILFSYFSHQVSFQPAKAIFVSVDVLLAVHIFSHFSSG